MSAPIRQLFLCATRCLDGHFDFFSLAVLASNIFYVFTIPVSTYL